MGLPRVAEARPFYRAAKDRYEDSRYLLEKGRTIGAVYLAGYTVECCLKALTIASVAPARRKELVKRLRGSLAHSIEWLRDRYREYGHAEIPRGITLRMTRVAEWSTELRYETRLPGDFNVADFMRAVVEIFTWADGRM